LRETSEEFREVAGPQPHVRALLHEVDDAVGHLDLDLDLRVAREEFRQRRHELVRAEGRAHVHAQLPARARAEARHLVLRLLDVGEDSLRAMEERLAFRRERQAARGAVEEPHAEAVFHARHELRNGRGREPQLAGRRGEPALLDGADEGGHVRRDAHPICSLISSIICLDDGLYNISDAIRLAPRVPSGAAKPKEKSMRIPDRFQIERDAKALRQLELARMLADLRCAIRKALAKLANRPAPPAAPRSEMHA